MGVGRPNPEQQLSTFWWEIRSQAVSHKRWMMAMVIRAQDFQDFTTGILQSLELRQCWVAGGVMGIPAVPVLLDCRASSTSIRGAVQMGLVLLGAISGGVLDGAGGREFNSHRAKLGVFVNPFDWWARSDR